MNIIKVKLPGSPAPRIEKRALESIVYSVDLTELLSNNELATSVVEVAGKLNITDIKIKHGKSVEVRIPSSDVTTSQYVDHVITVLFSTNMNNTRAAVFNVRVHK